MASRAKRWQPIKMCSVAAAKTKAAAECSSQSAASRIRNVGPAKKTVNKFLLDLLSKKMIEMGGGG